ncbi:hypothetical protein CLIB1423_01S01750 [[Candida] railenensis]|uniref:Uncharacterized protein n=1 Tax=[Candida] railenensis TaxID=45579 RepID=A0A9P0QK99_9ASCO|nr:hypothetical protein CLIB1423_01S01750 [[Candida] railenensis]
MDGTSSLYTHGNGSSASILPMSQLNQQVSSVGFNTLKKWNTSNSQISNASTLSAATTSKGISRLFTRSSNKLSADSNQALKFYNSNNSEEFEDSGTIPATENKRSSTIFKFSKSKTKSNRAENVDNVSGGGNDSSGGGILHTKKRPDLTVQTTGHQSLKVPKKILTSSSIEDSKSSSRKNTVTSPVSTFHNLFHRSHSNSQSQALTFRHDDVNGNGSGSGSGTLGGSTPSKMQKMEESLHPHVHHHHTHRYSGTNNPNRTAIGLSSNNSNSAISDIPFAMVYNFTDPDYSVDIFDEKNSGQPSSSVDDHNLSIKDIQRKLMIPADQYFQSRLGKGNEYYGIGNSAGVNSLSNGGIVSGGSFGGSSSIRDSRSNSLSTNKANSFSQSYGNISLGLGGESSLGGLGIVADDSESYYTRYLLDFSKNNYQFFNNFLEVVKPIFFRSKERKLSNGSRHAYVGMTLEDVSNYVQDNYVKQVTYGTYSTSTQDSYAGGGVSPVGPTKRRMRGNRSTISSGENNSSSASTGTKLDISKIDDVIIREIYQDILTFCAQCMILFTEDFKSTMSPRSTTSSSSIPDTVRISMTKDWELIVMMWQYFNEKIRYQIITVFYPLEKFFQNCILSSSTLNPTNIEIESIILLAFRDIVLIPFFLQRANEYRQAQALNQSVSHPNAITYEEEMLLKENDNLLLGKIIDCMGVILTQTTSETGNADGEEHIRLEIFRETFNWVIGII